VRLDAAGLRGEMIRQLGGGVLARHRWKVVLGAAAFGCSAAVAYGAWKLHRTGRQLAALLALDDSAVGAESVRTLTESVETQAKEVADFARASDRVASNALAKLWPALFEHIALKYPTEPLFRQLQHLRARKATFEASDQAQSASSMSAQQSSLWRAIHLHLIARPVALAVAIATLDLLLRVQLALHAAAIVADSADFCSGASIPASLSLPQPPFIVDALHDAVLAAVRAAGAIVGVDSDAKGLEWLKTNVSTNDIWLALERALDRICSDESVRALLYAVRAIEQRRLSGHLHVSAGAVSSDGDGDGDGVLDVLELAEVPGTLRVGVRQAFECVRAMIEDGLVVGDGSEHGASIPLAKALARADKNCRAKLFGGGENENRARIDSVQLHMEVCASRDAMIRAVVFSGLLERRRAADTEGRDADGEQALRDLIAALTSSSA